MSVAPDCLVENFRLRFIKPREIAIEQHRLVAHLRKARTGENWIIDFHERGKVNAKTLTGRAGH